MKVCKFLKFYATLILREINFDFHKISKAFIFGIINHQNCRFDFTEKLHPWTLVIYQGHIYLLIEVKLAASTEPPGNLLSTSFRQQVTWVLLFNFRSHGFLNSQ